ncbi:MAG: HAMP domain-containing histidine kinase [Cyclobacteriaceae bacterium]|nr:HAMP domain-containing histidine kinase [Cyclobacteriaceae bacterium]
MLASLFTIYYFSQKSTEDEFYRRLREKAITSAILLLKVEQVDSTLLKTIDLSKHDVLFCENISILDEQEKEIYTNNDTIQFDVPTSQLQKIKLKGDQRFSQREFDIVGITFKDKGHSYIVLAGAVDIQGQSRLKTLRRILVSLFSTMVAIVGVAGWIYAGRALRPIQKVVTDVQNISTIDLSQRLHNTEKPDEIGNLVSMFNNLLGRIENSFTLQKTFLTNVSHELKNPLTKITSQLEVTLLNSRSTEEYKEIIQSVLDDIKELNQLSNSLLDLAYLDQNNMSLATSRIRIDEVLWEVRENIHAQNSSYKVDIHTVVMPDNEEDLYLQANLYLLKTALQNLIENACKFSDDKMATVSLICSKNELEIRIFDNGPGIAKGELENIFQPFYRTDSTSKIRGHGIGLSLCQKIISIHNGTIEVDSTLGQGTQMTVIFKQVNKF